MCMYPMTKEESWMIKAKNTSSLVMIRIGYKLYNPNTRKIIIIQDVIFDGERRMRLATT